jgi:hypothetical protein
VELLTVAPATVLCPPHHWLIEGSNTQSGHQNWTCYRCGVVRAHQDTPGASWSFARRQSQKPRTATAPEAETPIAG